MNTDTHFLLTQIIAHLTARKYVDLSIDYGGGRSEDKQATELIAKIQQHIEGDPPQSNLVEIRAQASFAAYAWKQGRLHPEAMQKLVELIA